MSALAWLQRSGPVVAENERDELRTRGTYRIFDVAYSTPDRPFRAMWIPTIGRGWNLGEHALLEQAKAACQGHADKVEAGPRVERVS